MVQYALDGFGGPACNVRFDGPHPSEQAGVGNCFYFSPFGANIYRSTFDPNSGYGAVGSVDVNGNLVLANAQETMDVLNYSIQTESKSYSNRGLMILEGVITGDLFDLPGGAAGLALGLQNRRHSRGVFITNFRQGFWQGFLDPSIGGRGSRQVEAMFGELWLPVLDQVEVQVAVRREAYTPGLSNTDPKLGVRYALSDWLSLRASYGTSFRAPSLGQVVGNDTDAYVTEIADPLDPAEFNTGTGTFRTILVSKNPDLEPEESTNYNLGFSLTPEVPWGDGDHAFQVDVDWFSLTFENQVRAENANQVVREDPCGPQVQRDPTNAIQNPLLQQRRRHRLPEQRRQRADRRDGLLQLRPNGSRRGRHRRAVFVHGGRQRLRRSAARRATSTCSRFRSPTVARSSMAPGRATSAIPQAPCRRSVPICS